MASVSAQEARQAFESRGYAFDHLYRWYSHLWASIDWLIKECGFADDLGQLREYIGRQTGTRRRVWQGVMDGSSLEEIGLSQAIADLTIARTILDVALHEEFVLVPPTIEKVRLFIDPIHVAA